MRIEAYQQAISAQFPDLQIRSISFFREGWANRLCLVNNDLIFRFPVDASSEQQLLLEIRLLSVLAPELPLPIPNYRYVAPASDAYPHAFAGHPLIPGASYPRAPEALRQATWWRPAVGDFLSALHGIPIGKVATVGLQGYLTAEAWRDALAQKHGPYKEHVFPLMPTAQRPAVRRYLSEAIDDERMISFSPVVIHQDFGFHNVLVDLAGERVTGVVDFGSCSIGDPVVDISPEIRPYYGGEIDSGWEFRRDYYIHTSALEDLLYIVTCGHAIPDEEAVRQRKLAEISRIWSA